MKYIFFWGLILLFFIFNTSISLAKYPPHLSAQIVESNLINCFPENLTAKGKPVCCETSAVVYAGGNFVFGSDKPIPGNDRSAVFSLDYDQQDLDLKSLNYLTATRFLNAIKYEDFTLTPDGKYIMATTGFDRVAPDSNKLDNYNDLLFWSIDNPEAVKIVSPSTNNGVESSVTLRQKLSDAIKSDKFPEGIPYFKVEGLAAIPDNKLLFGIREIGSSYEDFDYVIKIVAASYSIENEELKLANDFKLIYDYNRASELELGHSIALSSLEYDPYGDRLYMLTSFEEGDSDQDIGGFLWTLSLEDLQTGKEPTLVFDQEVDSTPLEFVHKPEGIAVIGSNRVLVIHDDDRVLGDTKFHRQANQAAYNIVEFTP